MFKPMDDDYAGPQINKAKKPMQPMQMPLKMPVKQIKYPNQKSVPHKM